MKLYRVESFENTPKLLKPWIPTGNAASLDGFKTEDDEHVDRISWMSSPILILVTDYVYRGRNLALSYIFIAICSTQVWE